MLDPPTTGHPDPDPSQDRNQEQPKPPVSPKHHPSQGRNPQDRYASIKPAETGPIAHISLRLVNNLKERREKTEPLENLPSDPSLPSNEPESTSAPPVKSDIRTPTKTVNTQIHESVGKPAADRTGLPPETKKAGPRARPVQQGGITTRRATAPPLDREIGR